MSYNFFGLKLGLGIHVSAIDFSLDVLGIDGFYRCLCLGWGLVFRRDKIIISNTTNFESVGLDFIPVLT